jgi:hypothetical protein
MSILLPTKSTAAAALTGFSLDTSLEQTSLLSSKLLTSRITRRSEGSQMKLAAAVCLLFLALSACAGDAQSSGPITLELKRAVRLDAGGALNLSGLAFGGDGCLFVTGDNGPAPSGGWMEPNPVILRVRVDSVLDSRIQTPRLERLAVDDGGRSWAELARRVRKSFKFDLEGVAAVGEGRLWIIDERDRLLLEYDIESAKIREVAGFLELASWCGPLASGGINNGFEGIAAIGGTLFLANEMFPSLIARFSISAEGTVSPDTTFEIKDNHDCTGLDSDGVHLYALGRTASTIYRLDPETGEVTAAASFRREADNPEYRFRQRREEYRNSEGLALSVDYIFVVLDGNFQPSVADDAIREPLLLVYHRPAKF